MPRRNTVAILMMLCPMMPGCTGPTRIVPTAPAIAAELRLRSAGSRMDWQAYDQALGHIVTAGRVDYCCAAQDEALERAMARFAVCGPTQTPESFRDRGECLAYWINAYNASMVRSLVELVRPLVQRRNIRQLVNFQPPADLEQMYLFRIDGRDRTPAELRSEALQWAGPDPRVAFVLCGGRMGDPPLYSEAFLGDVVARQLEAATSAAIEAPQIVTIDHGLQYLRVWRHLADIRSRLVSDWRARHNTPGGTLLNVLLEWATPPYRAALNAAIGYTERTLPFDNHINQVPPPKTK